MTEEEIRKIAEAYERKYFDEIGSGAQACVSLATRAAARNSAKDLVTEAARILSMTGYAIVPSRPPSDVVEALKPFAEEAEAWHEMGDSRRVIGDDSPVRVRDLRRAREVFRALSSSPAPLRMEGNRPLPIDRETLGRLVREAWVRWAQTQPNPKPSWLLPFDELEEQDKEADRQIGEAIARWTLIHDAARASLESPPTAA